VPSFGILAAKLPPPRSGGSRLQSCLRFGRAGTMLAVIPFGLAVAVWSSWVGDSAVLKGRALAVTAGLTSDSARIRAINDWVYNNQGFDANDRFFILPVLGPTPVQVLESGGDCSDKSRLVSALLRELGIESGLVMIFPCRDCVPIHTLVEAQYENGRMVVDPIWHIDYPAADEKFLGIRDLAGTSLGREHLAQLQAERGPADKIRSMPDSEATFDFAKPLNWDKNSVTRLTAYGVTLLGYDPAQLFRPYFLEDPKLALTLVLVVIAVMIVVASFALGFVLPAAAARLHVLVGQASSSISSSRST